MAPGLWELCQPQSITASRRRLRFPSRSREQLPAFMAGTSHTEARGKSRGARGPGGWLRLLLVCPSVADTDCEHPGEARRPLHLASYGANETPSPLTMAGVGNSPPGTESKAVPLGTFRLAWALRENGLRGVGGRSQSERVPGALPQEALLTAQRRRRVMLMPFLKRRASPGCPCLQGPSSQFRSNYSLQITGGGV